MTGAASPADLRGRARSVGVTKAAKRSGARTTVRDDNRMSALLLVALGIATTGLHSVLEATQWWFPAFGVMFVVFTFAAVVRFYVRPRFVATVAGIVAGILIVTLFFASSQSFLGFIPTASTLVRFDELTVSGNASIAQQSLPAIASNGIEFLICVVVGVIAVLMDAAANWWRAPALVGIPLLIVVVIPSVISNQSDGFTFILTAAVYLFIVLSRGRRPQPRLAIAAGVVATLGALIAPSLLPPVVHSVRTASGFGLLSENINPIINLGADLRDKDPQPVLNYTTTAATGEYLQLTTLDTFEGEQWAPDTPALVPSNTVKKVGAAPGLAGDTPTTDVSTSIAIGNANSAWLPVPYPETRVTGLTGTWLWDSDSLAIRTTDASTPGQTYTVSSLDVEPTIAQLEAANPSPNNPLAKVPAGLNPIVAATAKRVTANAKTDFDKAVALQDWFRGGTFRYSTKAPKEDGYDGSGLSIIVPFLKEKAGYCVHFATAMAIMARTLGIPSRVAVGFLPGQLTHPSTGDPDVYEVTTSDMHAWPELYFSGVGWVRFEPTPGKGFEPDFPSSPSGSSTTPSGAATAHPGGGASTAPIRTPKPILKDPTGPSSGSLGSTTSSPTAAYGGLGVLVAILLALVPAVARVIERRRRFGRIRRGEDSASLAWQELLDTARDLGLDVSSVLTPKELTELLITRLDLGKRGQSRAAIRQLLRLVEYEAFSRPDPAQDGDLSVSEEIADQLRTVLRGLRSASSPIARFTATFTPASLLGRVFRRSTETAAVS